MPGFSPKIVPRTGVEPVIPALKGRCPGPLDERGAKMCHFDHRGIVLYCWCFVKKVFKRILRSGGIIYPHTGVGAMAFVPGTSSRTLQRAGMIYGQSSSSKVMK